MKKLLLALFVTFTCVACEPEEFDFTPNDQAKTFTFPSVFGANKLTISIMNPFNFSNYMEYEKERSNSDKLFAIATYEIDCEPCRRHAPYFEKLAQQFSHSGIYFAILFIEDDKNAIEQLDYLKDLHVPVYYNAENFCRQGLNKIATPSVTFIAHEKANYTTSIGWTEPDADKDTIAKSYKTLLKLTTDFCQKNINLCVMPHTFENGLEFDVEL